MDTRSDGYATMTPEIPTNGAHAPEYAHALYDAWPLFTLAFGVALASSTLRLKSGFRGRSWCQMLAAIVINSVLTASIATGTALIVPYICPTADIAFQIGTIFIVASFGAETIKYLILKKLGLSVVDLSDPCDLNHAKACLGPEKCKKHMQACPFKAECRDNGS